MKYWVKLSRILFRLAASRFIRKIKPKSIESALTDSLSLLTAETADEVRNFVLKKQTPDGGFSDRAGKSDLYYSLFGYFVAEAYAVNGVNQQLKSFIKKEIENKNLSGVHLYCASILYAKLFGFDDTACALGKKIKQQLSLHSNSTSTHQNYSSFMGFLALYYQEDFPALKNVLNQYRILSSSRQPSSVSPNQHPDTSTHHHINTSTPYPCPVTAANAILRELSNHPDPLSAEKIRSFLQPSGGFRAVLNAPCEDLLSTGVALYALRFIDSDIKLLKPNCLSFVDDLYENGGFRATQSDFETDIEYTFYGLLALGALK